MPLWDYGTYAGSAEREQVLLQEEAEARAQNGHFPQKNWWVLSQLVVKPEFFVTPLPQGNMRAFIADQSADVAHVAILVSERANMDFGDMEDIFARDDCHGATILAGYIMALSTPLEEYFSSTARADLSFIKAGEPQFWGMAFSEEQIIRIAELWHASSRTHDVVWDCGRKQVLYARMQAELEAAGLKPDWFIDKDVLLPRAGRQVDSDYFFYDQTVCRIPAEFQPLV